jgi:hypothetical protein
MAVISREFDHVSMSLRLLSLPHMLPRRRLSVQQAPGSALLALLWGPRPVATTIFAAYARTSSQFNSRPCP